HAPLHTSFAAKRARTQSGCPPSAYAAGHRARSTRSASGLPACAALPQGSRPLSCRAARAVRIGRGADALLLPHETGGRAMSETVMQAESLTRHYHVSQGLMKPQVTVKALVDVSFELQQGRTLAVVGESGCGKSTLARQLTLIEAPTQGRLKVGEEWVEPGNKEQYKRLRSQVQMVFQNPYASLNPRQKIGHQIGEPLLLNTTLSAAERKAKVDRKSVV